MTIDADTTGLAASTVPPAQIVEWVTSVVESLGYIGVAGLIALENLIPPIPSELILPLAGFLAGQGRFWLPAVVLAATIGSVVGALILYGLGVWLGEERLRGVVARVGRFLTLQVADVDRADRWFDRHGGKAVLIGRLVPVVRSVVSIPAGLRRMPLGRFLLYTALGSAIWNSVLIGLGWMLGERWNQVSHYSRYLEYGVLVTLLTAVVWVVWRRRAFGGRAVRR